MFTSANDIREVTLGDHPVSVEEFVAVARHGARVEFGPEYVERVVASRGLVERFLREERVIYGVTTGFGDNVRHVIATRDAATLQRNIVESHAVSVGEPLSVERVRAIQLMMLVGLGQGYSGTRLETLELIRRLLNEGITPWAPGEGSVGYLSVEAHMARVLIGDGRVNVNGAPVPAGPVLAEHGLHPAVLGAKEGLTLTNGTHSVTGLAVLVAYDAARAGLTADVASALSFEALKGSLNALDPRLQERRQHPEQNGVADNLRRILQGSTAVEENRSYRVQDPYVLRSIPQVHGGAKRAIKDAVRIIEEELRSVGDNPVIIPTGKDGLAISGANFDSTFVGLGADQIAAATTVLAKISERRTDRMINSAFSELPAFLSPAPGLNSGYMIPQYTAAALTMEMRAASFPASVDTVPTSANQEDPVSNAYLAVCKAHDNVRRLQYVLAIELMAGAQALDLRGAGFGSPGTNAVRAAIRKDAPAMTTDRFFGDDIENLRHSVLNGTILETTEKVTRSLSF